MGNYAYSPVDFFFNKNAEFINDLSLSSSSAELDVPVKYNLTYPTQDLIDRIDVGNIEDFSFERERIQLLIPDDVDILEVDTTEQSSDSDVEDLLTL